MNRRFRVGLGLFAIAATPRLFGAFFLPNTFGDAYVYIRDIGNLSIKLKTGTLAVTDLYGFWLPLYQFISAVINVIVANGFYTGKIVAALFGVGVCLLVYAITLQLVEHKLAALLAFMLLAFSPLHILTSTSALTDVPHAFFVLAALYFVLRRRWLVAAVFAALAGLTRVESWMLIALIPALQFWKERRVSVGPLIIMLLPPLFWFWVSWKAAGDLLATFKVRQQYHDWLMIQNPALRHFTFAGVTKDTGMFLSGVDIAVLIAAFVAGWLVLRSVASKDRDETGNGRVASIVPPLIFFFPFFALLTIAYLTHQQPIIFPRYGVILFSLGIPILAWTYFAIKKRRPEMSRRVLVGIIVLCALNMSAQLAGGVGELNRYAAQRQVADYLRSHFDRDSGAKIFCDEGTVRALSGLSEDRFLVSANAPRDQDAFVEYLHQNRVEYLVAIQNETSKPEHLFPNSEYGDPIAGYEFITEAHTEFLFTNIHVYRRTQ
ncbi:MAG TPA: glycosyltransferase family 39 protein [Pyrinomonadaceae bacterium]|nr:glycosyltransferase family 39 protein [Pyrinomonadaceae bacterium]